MVQNNSYASFETANCGHSNYLEYFIYWIALMKIALNSRRNFGSAAN